MNASVVLANLRKVNYCRRWWENGKGSQRAVKPEWPTVNGDRVFEPDIAKAKQRGLLDVWSPVIQIQFGNTHSLEFRKPETVEKIWRAWQGIVYRKPS